MVYIKAWVNLGKKVLWDRPLQTYLRIKNCFLRFCEIVFSGFFDLIQLCERLLTQERGRLRPPVRQRRRPFRLRRSLHRLGDVVRWEVCGRPFHAGPNVIILFTSVIYSCSHVFVPCRPSKLSLIFACKAGAYPSDAPFGWSTQG